MTRGVVLLVATFRLLVLLAFIRQLYVSSTTVIVFISSTKIILLSIFLAKNQINLNIKESMICQFFKSFTGTWCSYGLDIFTCHILS
jgi:hypothetical protein